MSIAPTDPTGVRFEDLPEQAWPRQEIIDGTVHVTPMASLHHQAIVLDLSIALVQVAPKELRVLAGANVLRRTRTDRLLIPDVLVIDADAFARGGPYVGPEDVYLAVEVVSPSCKAMDLHIKQQLYAEWGIGTYWVCDPDTREIHEFGLRESATCWLADVDLTNIWPD